MRTPPTIAIVAAVVAGAFLLGRASKHCGMDVATLDVKQRQEEKQAEVAAWRMEGEVKSNTAAKANTSVVIHRKYLPPVAGCAKGSLDTEDVQIGKQTEVTGVTGSANHADGSSSKLLTLNSESSVHAVAVPSYRFALQALAGARWSDFSRPIYGGQVTWRPFWRIVLSGQATTDGAAALVGLQW